MTVNDENFSLSLNHLFFDIDLTFVLKGRMECKQISFLRFKRKQYLQSNWISFLSRQTVRWETQKNEMKKNKQSINKYFIPFHLRNVKSNKMNEFNSSYPANEGFKG